MTEKRVEKADGRNYKTHERQTARLSKLTQKCFQLYYGKECSGAM